jgi:putative ABC transport system permease protein
MSGMFMGMGKSFTAAIDRSAADIMVLGPNAKQLFDSGSGVPRRIMPTIYTHPAIVAVDYIDMSGGRFQAVVGPNERARTEFVQVNSVVTTPGNPTI